MAKCGIMKTSKLFTPAVVGELSLRNRLVMAALTRSRSNDERVPNDLMAEYYGQRASAGMILTEGTAVSPMGVGYANTPGIWSAEQVEGWKRVTKKVHGLGGIILLQLWHVGRVSHPRFLNGKVPMAPSAVAPTGHVNLLRDKEKYVVPQAMSKNEIVKTLKEFKIGAENAQKAGFDGVEVHSGNGYLPDQFLQTKTNLRTDEYGGSVENRARFVLEATDAAISVWGAGRVGVNIAPRGDASDMGDKNPKETFSYLASQLGKRKIAFLYAREYVGKDSIGPLLKKAFGGFFIANEALTKQLAETLLKEGKADAASFGKLFIANPDLVKRFELNAELNTPNPSTFYTPGHIGYTDYPFLK